MTVVAPLLVVLQGQLVNQGTGNGVGTGKEMGLELSRDNLWLVEILFTNIARNGSRLTVVLFTN